MPDLGRRGFLLGGLAALAAPAIVHAGALMPIRGELLLAPRNMYPTLSMITREAVQLFRYSNDFLVSIDRQYENAFLRTDYVVGSTLRIRLPEAYHAR